MNRYEKSPPYEWVEVTDRTVSICAFRTDRGQKAEEIKVGTHEFASNCDMLHGCARMRFSSDAVAATRGKSHRGKRRST